MAAETCTDPAADAEHLGLSFTRCQAAWVNHHIRNGLVLLLVPTEANLDRLKKRLLAMCDTARARMRQ